MASPVLNKLIDLDNIFGWNDSVSRTSIGSGGLRDLILDILWMLGIQDVVLVHPGAVSGDTAGSKPADWTESASGTFDATAESATPDEYLTAAMFDNYLECEITAATDGTQYIELLKIDGASLPPTKQSTGKAEMDWRDSKFAGFWLNQTEAWAAGELVFAIVNENSDGTQTIGKVNIPATSTTAVWQFREVDISGLQRDRVSSIRLYANNATAADTLHLQGIWRYRQGYGRGPVSGKCEEHPVTNAQTPVAGDLARLVSPDMTVQSGASDSVDIIGVFAVVATGTATQKVKAILQAAGYANLRAADTSVAAAGEGVAATGAVTFDNAGGANDLQTFGASTMVSSTADQEYPIKLGKGPITVV